MMFRHAHIAEAERLVGQVTNHVSTWEHGILLRALVHAVLATCTPVDVKYSERDDNAPF